MLIVETFEGTCVVIEGDQVGDVLVRVIVVHHDSKCPSALSVVGFGGEGAIAPCDHPYEESLVFGRRHGQWTAAELEGAVIGNQNVDYELLVVNDLPEERHGISNCTVIAWVSGGVVDRLNQIRRGQHLEFGGHGHDHQQQAEHLQPQPQIRTKRGKKESKSREWG